MSKNFYNTDNRGLLLEKGRHIEPHRSPSKYIILIITWLIICNLFIFLISIGLLVAYSMDSLPRVSKLEAVGFINELSDYRERSEKLSRAAAFKEDLKYAELLMELFGKLSDDTTITPFSSTPEISAISETETSVNSSSSLETTIASDSDVSKYQFPDSTMATVTLIVNTPTVSSDQVASEGHEISETENSVNSTFTKSEEILETSTIPDSDVTKDRAVLTNFSLSSNFTSEIYENSETVAPDNFSVSQDLITSHDTESVSKTTVTQCPPTYTFFPPTSSCYKLHNEPQSFQIAENHCNLLEGGHLSSIHSEQEHIFLMGLYHEGKLHNWRTAGYHSWIGLVRNSNNTNIWNDGSKLDYSGLELAPSNQGLYGYISTLNFQWHFTSSSDSMKRKFICKKPSTFPQPSQFSNHHPCPANFTRLAEHCYRLFPNSTNLESAHRICNSHNSQLSSIDSRLENLLLLGLISKSADNIQNPWINLKINLVFKKWGSLPKSNSFENWEYGHAGNFKSFGAKMSAFSGRWISVDDKDEIGSFVCKFLIK